MRMWGAVFVMPTRCQWSERVRQTEREKSEARIR
jgi:hypothetical protein